MARPKKHKQQPSTPTITLSDEAFNTIQEAIENPSEPNEALLEAVQSLKENGIALEPPKTALDSISEETLPSVSPEEENGVNANTEPPEGIQDNTEQDNEQEPENYILDAWDRKVPAKDILVQTVRFTPLVEEVIYLASLGAELDTSMVPQLARVPFRVKLKLPLEVSDTYTAREDIPSYNENVSYLNVSVSTPDRSAFIKKLIELGKKGAIIQPKRVASNSHGFQVPLLTQFPVEHTIHTKVSPNKPIYTKDQLSAMSLNDVRIIGGWYGITGRGKVEISKEILVKQEERRKEREGE